MTDVKIYVPTYDWATMNMRTVPPGTTQTTLMQKSEKYVGHRMTRCSRRSPCGSPQFRAALVHIRADCAALEGTKGFTLARKGAPNPANSSRPLRSCS